MLVIVSASPSASVSLASKSMVVDGVSSMIVFASSAATGASFTLVTVTVTDEAAQTLTFEITTDNDNLFEVLPAIDANGTLTYTPAADATGTATVTVKLKDNGGTADGGQDTSATKTFTITLEPAAAPAAESDLPRIPQAPEEDAFVAGVDDFMASI